MLTCCSIWGCVCYIECGGTHEGLRITPPRTFSVQRAEMVSRQEKMKIFHWNSSGQTFQHQISCDQINENCFCFVWNLSLFLWNRNHTVDVVLAVQWTASQFCEGIARAQWSEAENSQNNLWCFLLLSICAFCLFVVVVALVCLFVVVVVFFFFSFQYCKHVPEQKPPGRIWHGKGPTIRSKSLMKNVFCWTCFFPLHNFEKGGKERKKKEMKNIKT